MAFELNSKLTYLRRLIRRQHFHQYAQAGPLSNTSQGQGRILAVLKMRDGISTRDLSYLLGIQVPSLNELIAKMVKAGYVTREPSEEDRRVMLIKLTDKGRSEEQVEPNFGDIFGVLNEDEQQTLAGYLDRIIASLEEKLSTYEDEEFERIREAHRSFIDHLGGKFDSENIHRILRHLHGVGGRHHRGPHHGHGPHRGHGHCGCGGHRAGYGSPQDDHGQDCGCRRGMGLPPEPGPEGAEDMR